MVKLFISTDGYRIFNGDLPLLPSQSNKECETNDEYDVSTYAVSSRRESNIHNRHNIGIRHHIIRLTNIPVDFIGPTTDNTPLKAELCGFVPRTTSCVSGQMYVRLSERQVAVVASNPFLVD